MRTTQGYHVGYAWVKEEQAGNGYKIYSYDVAEHPYHFDNNPWFKGNTYNYESQGRRYSYPVYPSPIDLERGNLLSEEQYNSGDKLVMSTRTTYESPTDVVIMKASKVELLKAPLAEPVWYVGYTHYPILTSSNRIKTTTVNTNYDSNGENPSHLITTYDYNGQGHLQATSVTKTLDDIEYVDNVIFPPDYGAISSATSGIKLLQQKNLINVPIETYTIRRATGQGKGSVINGTLTQFKTDTPLPDAVYSLKVSKPLAEDNFHKSNRIAGSFEPDASYEKQVAYYEYDRVGNVRELSKYKDIHIAYLWGYSNSKPIAEIKNATVSQVFHTSFEDQATNFSDSALTGAKSWKGIYLLKPPGPGNFKATYWRRTSGPSWELVETNISGPTQVGEVDGLIDEVRIFPPDALITTYTYEIGVGISTSNDARNIVNRYYYDALGRLTCVKDHSGHVLKTFTYHYKNQ